MSEAPDQVRHLDEKLRSVRFRTRESLKPEILGRIGRGDPPRSFSTPGRRRHLAAAGVAVLTGITAMAFAGFLPMGGAAVITVDRCCYDLDGGGFPDDGVLVLAERDSKVHRLRVYEDLDSSGSYTPGDIVRLDRGDKPSILTAGGEAIVTTKRCCIDFDGGGPADDGLLVLGIPPDRVLMAAIYETGGVRKQNSDFAGWLLR